MSGEVTCSEASHLSCTRDQIKLTHYMDRRVTPPNRVASPTWGPPPPCKQALILMLMSTNVKNDVSNDSPIPACTS